MIIEKIKKEMKLKTNPSRNYFLLSKTKNSGTNATNANQPNLNGGYAIPKHMPNIDEINNLFFIS
ncbi:MAG: hypothetical protein C0417_01680 [Chlorobiaceae bacterium]|nr:hypothetical protein [Chlorobiaceae bacterium]